MSSWRRQPDMLDRLNAQFKDVSARDWKLIISLLLVVNTVTLCSLGWLATTRALSSKSSSLEPRALAQAPATRTPLPTFTATDTPSPTPSPTNTLFPASTPTETPTPTDTPIPTDT